MGNTIGDSPSPLNSRPFDPNSRPNPAEIAQGDFVRYGHTHGVPDEKERGLQTPGDDQYLPGKGD